MSTPTKSNPRNLERVRANQQRSRDRKREYISELEKKVKQLEQKLRNADDCNKAAHSTHSNSSSDANHARQSSSVESSLATVVHENRVRGELLRVLGIDTETQDRFIRTAPVLAISNLPYLSTEDNDEARTNLAREIRPQQSSSHALSVDFSISDGQSNAVTDLQTTSAPTTSLRTDFSTTSDPLISANQSTLPLDSALCSSCSSGPSDATPRSPSDSTTACSIAFSMVLSSNKRGYNFDDLESKMRLGYQKSLNPGEECRILNKVLFDVLADII